VQTITILNSNPIVIEGSDAITIVNVDSAGNNQSSATEIPAGTPRTVAIVNVLNPSEGVRLPSISIGSVVEVYAASAVAVYPPSGHSFITGVGSLTTQGASFRRIDVSTWAFI
jgi:hypothetical protein